MPSDTAAATPPAATAAMSTVGTPEDEEPLVDEAAAAVGVGIPSSELRCAGNEKMHV